MNLTEFIRKNDIKCNDGEEFNHSPEFYKMKEFEKSYHKICGIPFLEPETYLVKEFDVTLIGSIVEKWNEKEKKIKRWFYVNRQFRYPGTEHGLDVIDDAIMAGKSIDEAIEMFEIEKGRFEFFRHYDLIDTCRYWLNRELKKCLVDEGKVVVIDEP